MASKATGTSGTIILTLSIVSSNAATRQHVVRIIAQVKNTSAPTFVNGASWSISPLGVSGSFDISGAETVTVYNGTTTITLDADGNARTLTETFNMGATGTSGLGGPTSVSETISLPALHILPAAPTGLTATRVSDTQVNLAWTQPSSGSNGDVVNHVIQRRKNQPAGVGTEVGWDSGTIISPSTTATVGVNPDEKWEFRVWARNSVGQQVSNISAPVYTTPEAPSGAAASKNASNNIVLTWVDNTDYAEHTIEVWHGTVSDGVTTWDGTALTTLAAGSTTYTHVSPNSSQVHIYRVRAVGGGLGSAYSTTNSVQLLAAPNKPTFTTMGSYADKAQALVVAWTHNPVDTTPQSAYEFGTSTDGGTTWASSGKVTSGVSSRTIAANTYAANATVTMRVRTWGLATTGGSDGTGASPWADVTAVTFKTAPTTTITSPANGGTVADSTLHVNLSFSQAEGATFVKASLQLLQGATILENLDSTIQTGITLSTQIQNGVAYTIKARVQDSNGIWSAWASNNFTVSYLAPPAAGIVTTFLPDTGFVQVDLTIPAPGAGQSAASTVTIVRSINGGIPETIVQDYPAASSLSFFDTTASVHGTNTYTVTTKTALGAQATSTDTEVTTECRRAYLSKGAGFGNVIVFGGNLSVEESLDVASDTLSAAGRTKPIGMYGVETNVQVKVKSFIFPRAGFSTMDQIRDWLLVSGKACYRDASGRRVFGAGTGGLSYSKSGQGDLNYTLTETS